MNFNLLSVALLSLLGNINSGFALGFSAIFIYQLQLEQNVTVMEESLIASLVFLGQTLSAMAIGMMSNCYGRQKTMAAMSVPAMAAWILIYFSDGNMFMIFMARFIKGVLTMTAVWQPYLTEIAPLKLKGIFGSIGPLGVASGSLLCVATGMFFHWKECVIIITVLNFIMTGALILYMPESPSWLFANGHEDEAERTLLWLRGGSPMTSISEELADMYASKKNSASESLTLSAMMKEFKQPIAYKPFIVLMVVSLLGMLTGGMTLVVYSVTILNDLGFSGNPYLPSLVVNGLRVALFISNLWVIGNTKRRPTMIWTSLLMTVSMALLGANLVYQKQILASYPGQAGWLEFAPLVWICIYCVGYTWGAGSMIWVLMGEMCPVKIRGLTSGVAVTMAYAAVTISTYATNVVMKTYGLGITFLGYGIICALNGLYAYIYLPETKNKTEKEKDYHYISRN